MELNINDLNLLIDHLREDIRNKENVIHLLTLVILMDFRKQVAFMISL